MMAAFQGGHCAEGNLKGQVKTVLLGPSERGRTKQAIWESMTERERQNEFRKGGRTWIDSALRQTPFYKEADSSEDGFGTLEPIRTVQSSGVY